MRHIQPKMVSYLDEKLARNGIAQHAIINKDARLLFQEAAKSCVGIREATGNNDGPLVELMQSTIGTAVHESWCMSFVQTMLAYSELKTGRQSRIFPSEHVLTVWNSSPKELRVNIWPLPGAIVIWQHGNTSSGHTGILLETDTFEFKAIEGNTEGGISSDGEVVREGGGVYLTERNMKGTGSMKVVGFLKPF